jgi:hypothetical protein
LRPMKTTLERELYEGGSTSFTSVFLLIDAGGGNVPGGRPINISSRGYDFEGGRTTIS